MSPLPVRRDADPAFFAKRRFCLKNVNPLLSKKSRTWEELRKEVPPKTFVKSAESD